KQPASARIFACLAALSITVCLAGCTNDDDVQLDDTTDASEVDPTEYIPASAEGPAQNVPEPNLPAVATENTEEGAKATLEYFWEAVAFARLAGDTSHLALVSDDYCEFCAGLMSGWSEVYEKGGWAHIETEMTLDDVVNEAPEGETEYSDDAGKMSFSFQLTEPAAAFYEEGKLLEDQSFETESTADWWVDRAYDATSQRWNISWMGLEEQVSEDPS